MLISWRGENAKYRLNEIIARETLDVLCNLPGNLFGIVLVHKEDCSAD